MNPTPWRRFYQWVNRNWWQIHMAMVMVILALLMFALMGCTSTQTREETQTEKIDKVTVTGSVPMQGADGIIQVPVSFTLDRTGTEQKERTAESKTGIDGEAIGRSMAAALAPVLSSALASTGVPWAQIVGGAGTAVVAATTGYLAFKKREQLKPERRGQS